jgi:hypothetical protein
VRVGERGSLSLTTGWPSTHVQYDIPTRSAFGIGVRGDFYYGMPVFGFAVGIGTGASVPIRIELWERDRWSLALYLRPGFYFGFSDGWWGYHPRSCYTGWTSAFFTGIEFEPGVRVGFLATPFLNVFFGATLPMHIIVIAPNNSRVEVDVFVPITVSGGIELALTRGINVFVLAQVGPSFGSYAHCAACDGNACASWARRFAAAVTARFYAGFTFHF